MAAASEESLVGTVDVLPEIVKAVGGKAPVIVDGGIRRGTDVFKALALGATLVGIGRPYIWGLGAFGQPGVEAALRLIDEELAPGDAPDGRSEDRKHIQGEPRPALVVLAFDGIVCFGREDDDAIAVGSRLNANSRRPYQ